MVKLSQSYSKNDGLALCSGKEPFPLIYYTSLSIPVVNSPSDPWDFKSQGVGLVGQETPMDPWSGALSLEGDQ